MRHNSTVLYDGPSMFDGATPIIAAYTEHSENRKTGPVGQVTIILRDVAPTTAIRSGQDSAICGGCIFAGGNGCYVIPAFAPAAIYRAYHSGNINQFNHDAIKRMVDCQPTRIGSYGDPLAIPLDVLKIAIGKAGHTGYTSSWQDARALEYKDYLMASVHTLSDHNRAVALGFRTYFTAIDGTDPASIGLTLCPASNEAKTQRELAGKPKHITCADCLLCDGSGRQANNIYSFTHGGPAVKAKIRKHEKAYAVGM